MRTGKRVRLAGMIAIPLCAIAIAAYAAVINESGDYRVNLGGLAIGGTGASSGDLVFHDDPASIEFGGDGVITFADRGTINTSDGLYIWSWETVYNSLYFAGSLGLLTGQTLEIDANRVEVSAGDEVYITAADRVGISSDAEISIQAIADLNMRSTVGIGMFADESPEEPFDENGDMVQNGIYVAHDISELGMGIPTEELGNVNIIAGTGDILVAAMHFHGEFEGEPEISLVKAANIVVSGDGSVKMESSDADPHDPRPASSVTCTPEGDVVIRLGN